MIQIQPLGKVDEELIKWLAEELEKKFATIVKVLPPKEIPKACFDNTRRQFNSTCILFSYKSEEITLLVTSEDIYAQGMNFVFGEAEIRGKRAIVSYYRLQNQDEEIFKYRVLKEAVHELGHVFGLFHCKTSGCVMNFSSSVFEVDKKSPNFCSRCLSRIKRI
ncbi:MAG: archaemetzincin family Zn-dependent metalloprotease [Archaeoglobaceae archaeon]